MTSLAGVAQPYPERPMRIIVNVTAGGGVDSTARVVAQHLNALYKQPVVVENRTGAGGSIGIELVAKATPDGYTLLVCSSGIITNAAYRKQGYDPIRDFQPVSILTSAPYIVVATPSLPAKSINELVTLARRKPDAVSYASSGVGGVTHLAAELLAMLSDTKMLHVPYKGVVDAYPAVAAGEANWMIGASISALPLVRAGRLRALAVTTPKRSRALPDLPTVAESVPGYEFAGWFGMFAPAGTPPELVRKLSVEAKRAMQSPAFLSHAEFDGTEVVGSSPAELSLLMKNELATWREVVVKVGIGQ
ncbi:MAG: h16 [Betaproteobacteria bacterium]|nr:h16 [Betaproteobacteria bacterium]